MHARTSSRSGPRSRSAPTHPLAQTHHHHHHHPRRPQALVLSPTRELATQTEKNIMAIGDKMKVTAHACIGGKSVGEDIRCAGRGAGHSVRGVGAACSAGCSMHSMG